MQNVNGEEKFDFISLGPKDDITSMEVYEGALDYAFGNSKIRNIAVTGSYGAGKSSVIESYKKRNHCEERFLHISLTHFENAEETDLQGMEAQLEGKIINQLAHKIGEKKLKDSSILMKKELDWHVVVGWSLFIFVLVSCTLYLGNYASIAEMNSKDYILHKVRDIATNKATFIIALIAEVTCVFGIITYLVQAQIKHRFFRKICIKDNEIELFQEEGESESYFDKYMDEIKYMLQSAEEDIFVFEDIDRYDTRLIFQKLREINLICNHNAKRVIRFLYLVRDDMFSQKDRTKFFDFIIPVLPVVNCGNSYEIFMSLFQGTELESDRRFFKQLSFYVDEMRLVYNIYNEFLIYEKILREISVGKTMKKIFSLIVYKNVFPEDYIRLQNNRGFIAEIFRAKEKRMLLRMAGLEGKVQQIEREIEQEREKVEKEYLQDENEIKAMYFPMEQIYRYKGKKEVNYQNRVEFIVDIINNPAQVERHRVTRYEDEWIGASTDVSNAIHKMEQSTGYQKCMERLYKKRVLWDEKEEDYREKIESLQREKTRISKLTVKQFIKKYGYSELYLQVREENPNLYDQIDKSEYKDLIQYLLTTGNIDENYGDLVTVFHGNDIKSADKRFVRAVLDGVQLPYDYEIEDFGLVRESLGEEELKQANAANISLFAYVIRNGFDKECNAMLDGIVENKQYSFIESFSEAKLLKRHQWVPQLAERHPQFVADSLSVMRANQELDLFVAAVALYADSEKLQGRIKWKDGNGYADIFIEDTLFEEVMKQDELSREERKQAVQNMVKFYQSQNIKNSNFTIKSKKNSEIFDAIYENNLYVINQHMLNFVFQEKYGLMLTKKGYIDLLFETDEIEGRKSAVHTYVEENIEDFLDMIEKKNIILNDKPAYLAEVIEKADAARTEMICEKMKNQIENIDKITSLKKVNQIIKKGKLKFLAQNIIDYYNMWCDVKSEMEGQTPTDMLLFFMNDFPSKRIELKKSERDIFLKQNDNRISDLFVKVAKDESLPREKYETFLLSLKRVWRTSLDCELPDERIDTLISAGIIEMSKETLKEMRATYPDHVWYFIKKNPKRYVEQVIDEQNFKLHECIHLLSCDVSDELKISLLKYTDEPITVQDEKYSDVLTWYLLQNNYDETDEDYLLQKEYQKQEIQEFIGKLAEDKIGQIISEHKKMSVKLFWRIIHSESIELAETQWKTFIAEHMSLLSREDLEKVFQKFSWEGFANILLGKNPLIIMKNANKILLDEMKEEKYISSYKEDKEKVGFYRVHSKRYKG